MSRLFYRIRADVQSPVAKLSTADMVDFRSRKRRTIDSGQLSCCFSLSLEMNRILSTTVSSGYSFLSWMVMLAQAFSMALAPNFSAAEPAAPSVPPPGATARILVVLGDSLAAGYGLDPSEAFPADLQKQLKAA